MRIKRNLFGRQASRPASGRWPLCAVAVAGGLLLMAPPAHAGHWEMSWRPDGVSFSQNYGGSSEWVRFLNSWNGYNPTTGRVEGNEGVYYTGNFTDGANVQGGSEPFWRALKVTQKGSITVYLKWVQDLVYGPGGPTPGPFIPAPKVVVLRFTGNAYAYTQSPTSQSEATTSFGDIKGLETLTQPGNSRVSDTHPNNTYRQTLREVRIPLSVPEGSTEVQYSFPLETKATTEQMPAPNQDNTPSVGGSFLVQMQRVDVGVAITSDIDASWKKFTGSVSDLPVPYKKRDPASHQLLNEPNDKAVLVSPNATDPSKSIWKIQCLRNADGTMTVESAAEWDRLQKAWFGGGTYTANSTGYYFPSYHWSWSGGTLMALAASDVTQDRPQIQMGSGSKLPSATSGDVNLGGTVDGNSSLTSSTATVTVYEPARSETRTDDSYTVNWHRNYENVVEDPATVPGVDPTGKPTGSFTYNMVVGAPTGVFPKYNTNQENDTVEVWVNPDPMTFYVGLNGNDWTVIGVVATVGTGGVAALPEAAVPAIAVVGKAWPAMAVCLGVTGIGYHYTSGPPSAAKVLCSNSSASWQQAVNETLQVMKDSRSVAPSGLCPTMRVDPPSLMNGFTLTQLNDTNWQTNPLWSKCTMTPYVKSIYQNHLYRGDGYDGHGYLGRVPSQLSSPYGSPQVVSYYTLSTTPSSP